MSLWDKMVQGDGAGNANAGPEARMISMSEKKQGDSVRRVEYAKERVIVDEASRVDGVKSLYKPPMAFGFYSE